MANPRTHGLATLLLFGVLFIGRLFTHYVPNLLDMFWLLLFGVLVDVDHFPFGRLGRAWGAGGFKGALADWKKYGWFDPKHLNFLHTWPAYVGVALISVRLGNWMPVLSFTVHCLVDSFSLSVQKHPRCSPVATAIGRLVIKLGLKRLMYETEEVPDGSPK